MRIQSDINLLDIWSDDAARADEDRGRPSGAPRYARHRGGRPNEIVVPTPARSAATSTSASPARRLPRSARSPTTGQVELLDVILRLGQVLDEQNIPETGRWVVIPAWAAMMLKQSELRQAYLTGDSVSTASQRPPRADRPLHPLHLQPAAARRDYRSTGAGGGRSADLRRSCTRPDLCQPVHQRRDDALRTVVRRRCSAACRFTAGRFSTASPLQRRSSSRHRVLSFPCPRAAPPWLMAFPWGRLLTLKS